MKLYHYTSVKNFKKIWESQSLKFSDSKRTNDLFEKRRLIQVHNVSFPIEYGSAFYGISFFRHFYDVLFSYRQISLCMDYEDGIEGCASPMMWGQYANNSKGICIELDSSKLDINKKGIWTSKIEYSDIIPEIVFDGCVFRCEADINQFIEEHVADIFFKKHFHWQNENEYRIISNMYDFLSVMDAITAVYVPNDKGYAFQTVDRMLKGSSVAFRYIFPATSMGGRTLSYMDVNAIRRYKNKYEK